MMVPPILQKAADCFYTLLDSELNITTANDTFFKIFNSKQGQPFLSLFPFKQQEQWKLFFHNSHNETAAIPVITSNEIINVEWSANVRLNNENVIEGYELLGVQSLKSDVDEISKSRKALARQETRFKSV